jgi:hypothetical protein
MDRAEREVFMNCLTARQTLDVARPNEPEACEPRADENAPTDDDRTMVEAAARHVEACPACQTAVRRQRQFDDKVAVMIREAPVPVDLKDRLLARLDAEALVEIGADSGSPTGTASPAVATAIAAPVAATPGSSRALSRRRWLGAAALAAACVAAGVGTWSIWPVAPSISPDRIAERLATDEISPDDFTELTRFAGNMAPKVPETMKSNRLVLPPRRLDKLDVAVYFFAFARGGPVDGRLAVIPKRLVVAGEIPQVTSFLAPPRLVTYKGGYCITAWTEGEFVYVCCLKAGKNKLEGLVPNSAPPA